MKINWLENQVAFVTDSTSGYEMVLQTFIHQMVQQEQYLKEEKKKVNIVNNIIEKCGKINIILK